MFVAPLLVLLMLVQAHPWVLVAQVRRQECRAEACQSVAGRPGLEHRVQTFATAEACVQVRDQMMSQADAATNAVNAQGQARSPEVSLRLPTTFVCVPETYTPGDPTP